MKKEDWEKAKNIFEQALTVAPDARVKFLDEVCSEDKIVRQEVEELLASHENTESFLETPLVPRKAREFTKGQIFNQYEIIELLGAGGMGEVYLALDTRLNRKVALKFLTSELTEDAERLKRFKQEAFAVSALNHPNILTIYEIGETADGANYLAVEYVEGETLHKFLKTDEITFPKISDIATQIVSALAAAHDAGIVHRDIKPENIMIRRDGIVKILDFGLAKTIKSETESAAQNVKTEEGIIIGTAAYMSPEQARGKTVDARTDIWSFGVVLYEMLAGRAPFEGETASDIIAAVLKTNPPPLAAETPTEFERIVNKTLRRDLEARYQTAKDLLVDLKNLKQNLELFENPESKSADFPVRKTGANEQPQVTSSGKNVGNFKLIAISAAVLLALVFGFVYYFRQNKPVAATTQIQETPKINSLAVLPFENAANAETEYLSDGITESLINSLSNLPNLRVISRGTVFNFKGSQQTAQQIGKALGVDAILSGKISQQGDELFIQAELVDVANGSQLWGQRFDAGASNLSQVQGKITEQITEKLQLKLNTQQKAQIAKYYAENTEAYREYLKGRFYTLQYTPEGNKKALEHLNRAIEIDPTYALAYAGIADAYTTASDTMIPPREAMPKAEAAAQKALELDSELAEAYAARGHARLHQWDKSAIEDLEKAIALAPNTMTNYLWLGEYYEIFAPEKATAVLEKAAALDPLSPLPNGFLSLNYLQLRQYEKGVEAGKKSIANSPYFAIEYTYIARIYLAKGDLDAALEMLAKVPPEQIDTFYLGTKGVIFASQGKPSEARKVLGEIEKLSEKKYVSPYDTASIYAALGDRDKAFFYLEKCFEDRSEFLGFVRSDPVFDSIRADARYAELLRKIGFTD